MAIRQLDPFRLIRILWQTCRQWFSFLWSSDTLPPFLPPVDKLKKAGRFILILLKFKRVLAPSSSVCSVTFRNRSNMAGWDTTTFHLSSTRDLHPKCKTRKKKSRFESGQLILMAVFYLNFFWIFRPSIYSRSLIRNTKWFRMRKSGHLVRVFFFSAIFIRPDPIQKRGQSAADDYSWEFINYPWRAWGLIKRSLKGQVDKWTRLLLVSALVVSH